MNRWLTHYAKEFFFRSLRGIRGGFLEIVCPEETYTFGEPNSGLRAMAVIHDERFFVRALTGADVGMGEAYMNGDWTTPDLVSVVRLAVRNLRLLDAQHKILSGVRALTERVRHSLRANTIRGSRRNINAHYDLGNDFYRLFLDERMMYSCAYFRAKDDSLELAQRQKLDLICQKLQIEPGDRVLEIGCGWGGFALHAARYYGAYVTAVTISPAQYQYVKEALAQAELTPGCVRLVLEDYRRLEGRYDKIVSIEMFEAVGLDHYDDFFGACDRLLTPMDRCCCKPSRCRSSRRLPIASGSTGSRLIFSPAASWRWSARFCGRWDAGRNCRWRMRKIWVRITRERWRFGASDFSGTWRKRAGWDSTNGSSGCGISTWVGARERFANGISMLRSCCWRRMGRRGGCWAIRRFPVRRWLRGGCRRRTVATAEHRAWLISDTLPRSG